MHTEIHTAAALGRRDQKQPPCRPVALDRPCYHQGKMKPTLLLCALLLLAVGASAQRPSDRALIAKSDKLIIVTTPEWNSVTGYFTRYARTGDHWTKVGESVAVVVGKNGMAWDPKITKDRDASDPVKHEGDGRSPAGVFALRSTFGFEQNPRGAYKYRPLTPGSECVDDVKSPHYNLIVDRDSERTIDWTSSEKMRDIPGYVWGAVVDYNVRENNVRGNGSCIFLHVWSGPGKGTAGCTAMPEPVMEELVHWLNDKTLLVQMPEAQYARMKKTLGTP
jgi:D-alanyl-D-alanine dipeptidase